MLLSPELEPLPVGEVELADHENGTACDDEMLALHENVQVLNVFQFEEFVRIQTNA
jgi:hypothetical protein